MIAEVAKGHGVNRFIFASTCSVYGASNEILDENSALAPVSLYARSKIACERILGTLADEKFAPVYLRFGTIYGLSGRPRFDLVVNLLAAKAVVDREITLVDKDQWRPFVHVQDAAEAIMKAIDAPLETVRNQVFNVGSDSQNRTIGEIGQMIHQAEPDARLIDVGTDGDRRNYRVRFTKVSRELQFEPRWTIEQGIDQVITAIRSGAIADFRDPRYSNVAFLREDGAELLRREQDWVGALMHDDLLDVDPAGTGSVPAYERSG
jgi:nucleoside-diphosphate-sugar epimerase